MPLHDVKIRRKKKMERAVLYSVAPEDFGVSHETRSMADCGYCFHEPLRRVADLIAEGFDKDQLQTIVSHTGVDNTEEMARDTVNENQSGHGGDTGLNWVNRRIKIVEHYIVMDYEGDGKPCRYRVTTGGSPTVILRRKQDDGKYAEDIVRWDRRPPFAVGCPNPMPHRFFGRSIADMVMEISRINTALMRGALNNIYRRVNPRVEVAESHASVNTLDDLLISRPGGQSFIRTRVPGGLQYEDVPDVTSTVFPALQYMDARREWRTGVTRQGQGVDPNALQNQVATIANQMETASQEKLEMIVRILAETGIKDLFSILHETIRLNGSIPQTIRLRGNWVTVDPREWKARNDMTINVGLGTGKKQEQLASLQMLVGFQQQAVQIGMVTRGNFYNSARELVKLVRPGGDVNTFFTDPSAPPNPQDPPLQPNPDPKMQDAQTKLQIAGMQGQMKQQEIQGKLAVEGAQMQADIMTDRNKAASEAFLKQQEAQQKAWLAGQQAVLKQREAFAKMQMSAAETGAKVKATAMNAMTNVAAAQAKAHVSAKSAEHGAMMKERAQKADERRQATESDK